MIRTLRQINRCVAWAVGIGFLGCAAMVLLDIALRQFGHSFGGTEEIAGYVLAVCSAWGMAYGMLELSHVRIDFLRAATTPRWRAALDLLAALSLTATITLIAIKCWPVVEISLRNGSRSNTPLEVPLAWVQLPWFAGWIWFALMSWLLTLAALILLLQGKFTESEQAIGVFAEQDKL